jgi:hypothetical protein
MYGDSGSASIDTNFYSNGWHTIYAYSYDENGNISPESYVNVYINNTGFFPSGDPSVQINAPDEGTTVWGVWDVSLSAYDDFSSISQINYGIDGVPMGTIYGNEGDFNMYTEAYYNGWHTVYAYSIDYAGNVSPTVYTDVYVENIGGGGNPGRFIIPGPKQPTNCFVPSVNETLALLTWDLVVDAVAYVIVYNDPTLVIVADASHPSPAATAKPAPLTCSSKSGVKSIEVGKVNNYSMTGLAGNSQYNVVVCAKDSKGNLSAPAATNFKTLASAVTGAPAPTSLNATNITKTGMSLNWTSGGLSTTGFQVSYLAGKKAPASCKLGTILQAGKATTLAVSKLKPSTNYTFMVCSKDAKGDLTAGPSVSVLTSALPIAQPAKNLTDSAILPTSLNLSWVSGGGTISGYHVVYQAGAVAPKNCKTGKVLSAGKKTSVTVRSLIQDTEYTFMVCALDASGAPVPGPSLTATTALSPAPAPKAFHATAIKTNQLTLDWASGKGVTTGFVISYLPGKKAPTSCSQGTVLQPGDATSYVLSGLTPASFYSFMICSKNSAGTLTNGPKLVSKTAALPKAKK